jgi:multicomponent K+:H+ antiporter subunit E
MNEPIPPGLRARLLPHPALSLVLILVWLLLANAISPAQVLLGTVLGWAIPLITRGYWPVETKVRRPMTLLRLVATLLYDILIANLTVAWAVLFRWRRLKPGFAEVPVDLRSDVALSLFANTVSLTPGTLSAYLTPDRRTLVVHALDVESTERLATELKTRYETPIREVFESC